MPTHKGTSQTDITIGSGGTSATETTSFEFDATYATVGNFQYLDLATGADRRYSAYELRITNATGAVIATFAARYKAWIDAGSATGPKTVKLTDNFVPLPNGNAPAWPSSAATIAERTWSQAAFDGAGGLFATLRGNWQVRTTVQTGASVIQTVVDQTESLLRLHMVYLAGDIVLLDNVVTMTSTGAIKGRLTLDPPDITDRFIP
ncbi:hypothetical protein ACNOYE_22545 [Nannocystaceae bacterium ST9]